MVSPSIFRLAEMIDKKAYAARLPRLREALNSAGVDGFLVPLADEYQSEFPPPGAQRLAWLTGFGGSAGIAAVLSDRAAIFVDGRYTLQVRDQVDTNLFEPRHLTQQPLSAWLTEYAAGKRIGYDPWLHTADGLARLETSLDKAGVSLVPMDPNPLDQVWEDQPPPPADPAFVYGDALAGRNSADKRAEIAGVLKREGADAAVITAPESIAWLLNIRGNDLSHTPVALSFAIIRADGAVGWFIAPEKVPADVAAHVGPDVTIAPRDAFAPALEALGAQGGVVMVARATAPVRVMELLEKAGAKLLRGSDPCELPKACKNSAEIAGIRAAHIRDGAALSRFLCWLSETAPDGGVDELSAAAKLYDFRAGGEYFHGLSFDTISGAGSNGAIVHYRVTDSTNRALEPGMLYLVDSGAQYLDGTTDVTRTVAIGAPTDEMRDRFTRVLKGHIAIATARFPAGTSGGALDSFARRPLWQAGLDFDHGTGHGVGCFLGVHEGPQRIAKRAADVPLRPGMVVSNEPGFYKEGGFGIRIENLELVRTQIPQAGEELEMLAFEALTLAPIDRTLVDVTLLDDGEIAWWNGYHKRVLETVGPLVDEKTRDWMEECCAPLTR